MTLQGRAAWILALSLATLALGSLAVDAWVLGPALEQGLVRSSAAPEVLRLALLRAGAWTLGLSTVIAALALSALQLRQRRLLLAVGELRRLSGRGAAGDADADADEIVQLAGAVAGTLQSLREDLGQRARQLEDLQRREQADALTGLPQRQAFLERLQDALAQAPAGHSAVLLLRVPQLATLNLRLGREATDRLLHAIGQLLQTYVDRVAGAHAGRLNGSDFALFLPASGVAAETAQSLREALSAVSALRSAAVRTAVGGVDGLPAIGSGAALAEADAALARAESGEGDGVVVDQHSGLTAAAAGASAWRAQILGALEQGRLRLQEQRVLDRHGQLVHLSCLPELQLDGPGYQPPRLCLALARRSRLQALLELATLRLALQASAGDGQARCVRVSAPSLETPSFIAEVAAALRGRPAQAAQLAIVMPWPEQAEEPVHALVAAAAAWRLAGARVGIESTGATAQALAALPGAGVGFVIVDAQPLRGLAGDTAAAAHASDLFALIHGLGLAVLAEGELAAPDLQAAWPLGLDGAAAAAG